MGKLSKFSSLHVAQFSIEFRTYRIPGAITALSYTPQTTTALAKGTGEDRAGTLIAAKFGNGAQIAIGGERGGIGGNFALSTYRARASVPFAAQ
jgi:hypothetical protein